MQTSELSPVLLYFFMVYKGQKKSKSSLGKGRPLADLVSVVMRVNVLESPCDVDCEGGGVVGGGQGDQ